MVRTRLGSSSLQHVSTSAHLQRQLRTVAVMSVLGASTTVYHMVPHLIKEPMYNSMHTGEKYIQELLTGHGDHIRDTLGLRQHVFQALIQELKMYADLKSTKHVSVEEQLAIFLCLAHTGLGQREARERSQRSTETVSVYSTVQLYMLIMY